MRVTGAQGLAAAGRDLWAIQLLGRWGSMAIRTYVREAHLEQAEVWARRVAQHTDIDDITESLANKVEKHLRGSEVWKALEEEAAKKVTECGAVLRGNLRLERECAEALAVEALPKAVVSEKLDVVISASGVCHEVAFGPPEANLELAITSCGWRFGGSSGAKLAPRSEMPNLYKRLCARCFPEEREAMKKAFADEAKDA